MMSTTIVERPLLLESNGRTLDELSEAAIWEALDSHGAILFRGFGADSDANA